MLLFLCSFLVSGENHITVCDYSPDFTEEIACKVNFTNDTDESGCGVFLAKKEDTYTMELSCSNSFMCKITTKRLIDEDDSVSLGQFQSDVKQGDFCTPGNIRVRENDGQIVVEVASRQHGSNITEQGTVIFQNSAISISRTERAALGIMEPIVPTDCLYEPSKLTTWAPNMPISPNDTSCTATLTHRLETSSGFEEHYPLEEASPSTCTAFLYKWKDALAVIMSCTNSTQCDLEVEADGVGKTKTAKKGEVCVPDVIFTNVTVSGVQLLVGSYPASSFGTPQEHLGKVRFVVKKEYDEMELIVEEASSVATDPVVNTTLTTSTTKKGDFLQASTTTTQASRRIRSAKTDKSVGAVQSTVSTTTPITSTMSPSIQPTTTQSTTTKSTTTRPTTSTTTKKSPSIQPTKYLQPLRNPPQVKSSTKPTTTKPTLKPVMRGAIPPAQVPAVVNPDTLIVTNTTSTSGNGAERSANCALAFVCVLLTVVCAK